MKRSSISLVAAIITAAATGPSTSQAQSIVEIASTNEDFSTLAAAVVAAGLEEALSEEDGTFTVFAPTNDAFGSLPEGTVEKLLEPEWFYHLQDVLLYHVLDAVVTSSDLSDGLIAETLNDEDIVINLDEEDGGASITTVSDTTSNILVEEGLIDIEADNGIIHAVDSVLLPTSATKNIVDIASSDENFSTLVEAVVAAGLVDALSGDGPLTVFAPTNDAMANLPEGTLETLLLPENKDQLVNLLQYHVVPGNVHSSDLSDGDVETLNGDTVDVDIDEDDGAVTVNDANVIAANILASNGIIHVIDAVLLPPEDEPEDDDEGESLDSIYDIASNNPDFSILTAAIDAAELDGVLSDEGNYTVFAPINDAFDALPEGTVEKLLDPEWFFHLQDLLLYHALGSVVGSTDLSDGLEAETLNAEDIVINLDDDGASITTVSNTSSEILIEEGLIDIEASNGIIHAVDSVLLPTSATQNIVDIGQSNEDFSTLVAAAIAADLVETLSGEGPFTLFAPTNDAFASLPEGTVESLLLPENQDQLIDILTYHVIPGIVHSSTLSSGAVEALNGAFVDISTDGYGVMVNDANVIVADILASNGIIHVIDAVLLPTPPDADVDDYNDKEEEKEEEKEKEEPPMKKPTKPAGNSKKSSKATKIFKSKSTKSSSKSTKSSKSSKSSVSSSGKSRK